MGFQQFFLCVSDSILFCLRRVSFSHNVFCLRRHTFCQQQQKVFTVVSADFQPRCGVKNGTLPRNRLASSATGGDSVVSKARQQKPMVSALPSRCARVASHNLPKQGIGLLLLSLPLHWVVEGGSSSTGGIHTPKRQHHQFLHLSGSGSGSVAVSIPTTSHNKQGS